MAKIGIIGSGISGLSAACYLAADGHEVHVFEKNSEAGGRARQFTTEEGYVFDMGPSWYWMPDVFEGFFNDFGYTTSDMYRLELLDPAFDVVFGKDDIMSVPHEFIELQQLFESLEPGSAYRLKQFMEEAEFKYNAGMKDLVYRPGLSVTEFADLNLIRNAARLQVFRSFSKHIRKYFSNPKLLSLMEFPVLFLGASPQDTPALYSLMNYAGLKLGTWYPMGGFGSVINAFKQIALKHGVKFHFDSPVTRINTEGRDVTSLTVNNTIIRFDGVIASADYNHVEKELLEPDQRNYPEQYWDKRTFAPSSLIFYLGVNKQIESLNHHTLFFDESLEQHTVEIYKDPQWPTSPLFYVCRPSKTDPSVAPAGKDNLFILMPIATGLPDNDETREKYFDLIMDRLEKVTGEDIRAHLDYKRSYSVQNFITDYNAYKGNAYGLANTLRQTALLKPKIRNRKINNMFYTGQLTVPGPGVPPCIISGKVAAGQLIKSMSSNEIIV